MNFGENVFLSFNLLVFLFWLFISTFIPGIILSFSIFKKDSFNKLEKALIGFALGFILLPLIPFLLYFAGIKFSYAVALVSVCILYLIAAAFFVKNKAYEGIALPSNIKLPSLENKEVLIAGALVIILVVSYMIRVSSYGPIFQELDPYYYTYAAQQLLVLGENPVDDKTSWYNVLDTEHVVDHRIIPEISYLEAIWYSLYAGEGEYNNMLLSVIAGMYPPLAAIMAIFFIYLVVSTATHREWGIIAAGIAAFIPIFMHKLAAGEMEAQPYAFFSLTFLYAMYGLMLKTKDLRFGVLAGLGFAAVSMGSASESLAAASLIAFMLIQAVAHFLRDEDVKELKSLFHSNLVVAVIGPLLATTIIMGPFSDGELLPGIMKKLTILVPFVIAFASVAILYIIKQKIPDRQRGAMILATIVAIGLLVYLFTPLGDHVKKLGQQGFGKTEFRNALDRTIAEQGVAPSSFGSQMGFIGDTYVEEKKPAIIATILWPLVIFLNAISSGLGDATANLVGTLIAIIMLLVSAFVNIVFSLLTNVFNIFFQTAAEYTEKDNSLMLFWVFAFWVALAYSLYKFVKKDEDNLFMFIFAIVMVPFLVGIIKAKYTIYSAVLLTIAIGFSFGVLSDPLGKKIKEAAKYLLIIGAVLIVLQFVYDGFAISLFLGSAYPLYQNDPVALAPKFQAICTETQDSTVCAAAADPMGYASQGTNYQYNQKLCLLSVFSDPSYLQNSKAAPFWETQAAYFRCHRISTYWIDSMEWLKENSDEDARVISWWDYGHWTNFFGNRNTVLRNEHGSEWKRIMIGSVADAYLDATPEELKELMKQYGSEYALFDIELLAGGGMLGGKYGALNYLSCDYNGATDVTKRPGQSECEAEHLWETIFVSQTPCTISSLTNKKGLTAYKIYEGGVYTPNYRAECVSPQDQNAAAFCQSFVKAEPVYCVGEAMLVSGETTTATYYLNETYPNGDLKLNKAIFQFPYNLPTTLHMGPVTAVTLLYTNDPVWLENGEVKSGYEDRKGKFYDSNLYRGIFLRDIPGFKHVYSTSNGAVQIYKVE